MSIELDEYRTNLEKLRKNKANVSLDDLKTKYRKSYMGLLEQLRDMTGQLLQDIVFSDLLIRQEHAEESCKAINEAIEVSGLMEEIGHAVYQKQDADLVLAYAGQLREIVHRIVEEMDKI